MRAPAYLACLLALAPVVIFAAATDDLEFIGVMIEPGKTSVLLRDKASGRSRWIVPGESVGGYKFGSYDANAGTASVTKDNVTSRLTLKTSKVGTAPVSVASTPPPPAAPVPASPPADPNSPEAQRRVLNNLRQIGAAADQYFLEKGVSRVAISDLVGPEPSKYIKQLVPVAGEDYAKLELVRGGEISVTLPNGVAVKYSR